MMAPNNILDANIDAPEAEQLRRRLKAKKIGLRFLPAHASDEQIIGLSRSIYQRYVYITTQDCKDFYVPRRCDKQYCIICLDVPDELVAITVRKIYRHPQFNTAAKRMGKVIKVTSTQINYFEVGESKEITIPFQP